jgi:hypothetical protein
MKSSGQSLRTWAGIAGFLWFVLVVGMYFIQHKPFTPEIAIQAAGIFWNAAVALAVWCLAGGLGHKLLGKINISPLEGFSIQSAFGLGLLGTAWLLIGATFGFGWIQGSIVGLILVFFLYKDARAWLHQLVELKSAWKLSGWFGRLLGGEILFILLATLTIALAPPVKFDAMVYHLRLPDLYLDNGRFYYVPEIMFWGMPQIGEMLFTWAISIGGYPAAAIIGWLSGLTAMVGLFGLIENRLGLLAAWSGLASLLAGYTLAISLSWGYVDWLVILFGTAFLISMQLWVKQKTATALLVSGAFAGMALATKYTAGLLIIAGTVFIVWVTYRRGHLMGMVRPAFQFLAAALGFFSPWLIKNFLATGSPVYPFLFPAGAMDQIRLDFFQGGLPWGGWLDTVFLPWRATTMGVEAAPGYSASIGPLLLGLSVWAWLGYKYYSPDAQSFLKNTALIFIPGLFLWMILGRFSNFLLQSRLYLGIFPAIAVLAGGGYQAFGQLRISGVRLGRITGGLILFVLGLTAFEVGLGTLRQESLPYMAGLVNSQAYRQQNLGMYALAQDRMNELPPGSRILFLWETRSLGCLLNCDPDEILDRWPHDLSLYGNAAAVLAAWKNQGYSHILYHQLGADFLRQEDRRYKTIDWDSLDRLKAGLIEISDLNGTYQLYEIR